MASNIGINYKTPEEYFLHEEAAVFTRKFDPSAVLRLEPGSAMLFETNALPPIVLMCGCPASGKSTFYWTTLKPLGYKRVNQDTLKTRDKCIKVAASYLAEQKMVAIDNMNADPETRAIWVELAKKHNVPVRCIYLATPPTLCQHNDAVRALATNATFNPERRAILPAAAFAGFASRFKEPKVTEGFDSVTKVEFKVSIERTPSIAADGESALMGVVLTRRRYSHPVPRK